jgi:hypothetical protein
MWLAAGWVVVAGGIIAFASPVPWLFVSTGFITGACLGFLQLKALRASAATFAASRTVMEVRRTLVSTRWGRLYVRLFWVTSVAAIGSAIYLQGQNAPVAFFGAYAPFALARELMTLRGTYELQRVLQKAA